MSRKKTRLDDKRNNRERERKETRDTVNGERDRKQIHNRALKRNAKVERQSDKERDKRNRWKVKKAKKKKRKKAKNYDIYRNVISLLSICVVRKRERERVGDS